MHALTAYTPPHALPPAVRSTALLEPSRGAHAAAPMEPPMRWGWATRLLPTGEAFTIATAAADEAAPRPGDVAVVEVEQIRNHTRIMTTENRRLRLYAGDRVVGVFGARYATDAFESYVEGTDDLHIVTGTGMVGTVRSRHAGSKPPTRVRFVGYVHGADGARVNLTERAFATRRPRPFTHPVLLVVGTGMNAGKTTAAAGLVKGLLRQGLRVAACKLTGSVSYRDQDELAGTGALYARDFSDYGIPSTFGCEADDLVRLFEVMMGDAAALDPDVAVVEIADGVLQRETALLLADSNVRRRTQGVVLAAGCALSALSGVAEVERHGHAVVAVSGCLTSAPLFVREFASRRPDVPVGSSADGGDALAATVRAHLRPLDRTPAVAA